MQNANDPANEAIERADRECAYARMTVEERAIVDMLGRGVSVKEISEVLNIKWRTMYRRIHEMADKYSRQ